jgi:hypothetical protein
MSRGAWASDHVLGVFGSSQFVGVHGHGRLDLWSKSIEY